MLDKTRRYYYSSAYQIIEERVDERTNDIEKQYVWGIQYVDELVQRDRDSADDGTLEEKHFALQDANYNLTCIVDANGDAQERYSYTPYGVRTIHDGSFGSRASSSYDWNVGHQGLHHDEESSLVYNRARMLSPHLGRFVQRDPLGYVDGMSAYQYCNSIPISQYDPRGLMSFGDAWDMYWNLDDEGRWFARDLMRWYAMGRGIPYKRGESYLSREWRDWTNDRFWIHDRLPDSGGWSEFMRDRQELQIVGREFYAEQTRRICSALISKGPGYTSELTQFDRNAKNTELHQLESMRLTLYGSKKINVKGFWQASNTVDSTNSCVCRVDFKWVTWRWLDDGDLHPGKKTALDSGETVDDKEFSDVASAFGPLSGPFPIEISWIGDASWQMKSNFSIEHVSGWPPAAAEAPRNGGSNR